MNKIISPSKIQRLLTESSLHCKFGRLNEARLIYQNLLEAVPSHPDVLGNLGTIELQFGNTELGVNYLKKSISVNPHNFIFLTNLGNGLIDLNKSEEAIFYFDKALKIAPKASNVLYNKARAYKALKKTRESIDTYLAAIQIDPKNPLLYLNIGFLFNELGDHQEALKYYNQGIQISPSNHQIVYNRGVVYANLKQYELAIKDFDEAVRIHPNFKKALYDKSLIKLSTKSFLDGWPLYENRWARLEKNDYLMTTKPELTTFNISDKKIFIWAEQGIGDQIIYSSLLHDALKTNNQFCVSLDPRLIALFTRSFAWSNRIEFIASNEKVSESKYDFHLPLGNLGKFFRNSINDFDLHPLSYLKANDTHCKTLRKIIINNRKKICGISWMSKNIEVGIHKSISLIELLPILSLPNMTFINLQYGDTKKEIDDIQKNYGLEIQSINEIDNFNDLDGLTAMASICDYIITSSNVTAHIAGALGKETYLLVPFSHGKGWYWGENDETSLWYPSIQIFRSLRGESWASPVGLIKSKLEKIYG
jgi:tetratricopeptide (TPR) repeat protein